jgi:peptide deformylase
MKVPIREEGDAVLRSVAKPVPPELFGTPELKKIISDMIDTMNAEKDGVAIAAPQIGVPYRIFLVRFDRVLPPVKEGEPEREAEVGVFINPELVRLAKKSILMDEGCLSVRNVYGKTKRKERATVRAYDENGRKFERGGGKVLAQAFQHEVDHLNGILFIDHAENLVEMRPNEEKETDA